MISFERIAFARRMLREPDCRVPRDRNDCTRALAPERTPSRIRPRMRIAGRQVGLMDRGRVRPRPQCVAPQPNRRGSFRIPVGSAGGAGQRASSLPGLVPSGNRGVRMVVQCSSAQGDHRQADLPNRLRGRLGTRWQASWGAADLGMMDCGRIFDRACRSEQGAQDYAKLRSVPATAKQAGSEPDWGLAEWAGSPA